MTFARILRITFTCCLLVAGCGGQNSSGPNGPDGDTLQYLYCEVVQVENEMHAQWAANRPTEGTIEWGFNVAFASVPCFLKRPYAKFYLKAVDMFYEGKPGYICDEMLLYHDDCVALPLVGKGLEK